MVTRLTRRYGVSALTVSKFSSRVECDDRSAFYQLSVDDLRNMTPSVFVQLDRLSRLTDKIYVHIDMDVLDPKEVMGHGNKVPNGPSSEQLARLFEVILSRYPKTSAIGFATI